MILIKTYSGLMQITHEYCAANQALLNIDMYNVYNPRVKKEATLSFNRDSEPAEVHKKNAMCFRRPRTRDSFCQS